MKEEWWESPVCWLCDWWWMLLITLVLALAAYFTRDTWMPAPPPIPTQTLRATPLSTHMPLPVITPVPSTATREPTAAASTYTAPDGTYTLAFPKLWPTPEETGGATQWGLPDDATVTVHSEPVQAGDTLESFAQQAVSRLSYEVIEQSQTTLDGEPAVRQEVAYPGQNQWVAVGYLFLHNGQKYQVALSGLDSLPTNQQDAVLQQFEQMVATFAFQP